MLEVDRMVERYEGSAAPIYPPRLSAMGKEGRVQATFVVDTTGQVDMASVQVLASDDPEFTESVRTALGGMRFRPATRRGRAVRQLVEQRFSFRIAPSGASRQADQLTPPPRVTVAARSLEGPGPASTPRFISAWTSPP